jgi:hypothetical protein
MLELSEYIRMNIDKCHAHTKRMCQGENFWILAIITKDIMNFQLNYIPIKHRKKL